MRLRAGMDVQDFRLYLYAMSKPTSLNIRLNSRLSTFVAENVGEDGLYDNASEYVRDLIRKDKERVEKEAFETLKAELQRAFSAPDSAYQPVDREAFLARAKARWAKA
jgi:antitoxin ParD1/3/4